MPLDLSPSASPDDPRPPSRAPRLCVSGAAMATVLAIALALLLPVSACDRSGGGGSSEGSGDGRTTATLWHSYGGRNREVLEALIERFNTSQPEFRVVAEFQGDYFEALAKLRQALVTDEIPTFTHVVGEALPYLWRANALADLTPWANGEAPLDLAELVPALTQDGYFAYHGREVPLFALPFNRSTPIAYYNRDIFDAAGLQPPTTWAELRETARALTVRDGDRVTRWGFEVPVDWWFWLALLYQAGGELLNDDLNTPLYGGAEGTAALQLLVDMAREDVTMRPPPGRDYSAWEVANSDFLAGNVAMIWSSTAFLSYLTENANFRVGAAPLPCNVRCGVPTGGTFFVMLRDAPREEQAAAWAFMRWMMQPEQTAHYASNTGYMPVNRAALELPEIVSLYEADPNYRVALDQLEHAVPFPFSGRLLEIQREHIQPRLELPVRGMDSIADALGAAQTDTVDALEHE